MLGLGIQYLNGWAMAAADGTRKERAEWPPHPDRVFMALAAAWFETGQDPAEGAALRWLETLPAPALNASSASERSAVVSFVPVNDTKRGTKVPSSPDLDKLKEAGLGLFPEHRSRQPRGFPVALPERDTVFLVWTDQEAGDHAAGLATLCRKVVSVGHSASLVQMWLELEPPEPNLVPVDGPARHRMRTFGPGRLEDLEVRCNRSEILAYVDLQERIEAARGKAKKALKEEALQRFGTGAPSSIRPQPGSWQGYAAPRVTVDEAVEGTVFDPSLVVLTLARSRLTLPSTLQLSEALRGVVFSACPDQPPPEWISGHDPEGGRSVRPHLAYLPLSFVGAEHADGRILGMALALPRGIEAAEAARCLEPLIRDEHGAPRVFRLFDGRWFECEAQLEIRESPPVNLLSETWTRPSRIWATVTPIVLDQHHDGADRWFRTAEVVKVACTRIGLPRPTEVVLQAVSSFEGAPSTREFSRLGRKRDGGLMDQSHAILVFDAPVRGPVLVGAGRYRGYGVCRPLAAGVENHG